MGNKCKKRILQTMDLRKVLQGNNFAVVYNIRNWCLNVTFLWCCQIVACLFYGFMGGVLGLCSLNTMVMVAMDRYIAIVKPFRSTTAQSITRVGCMLAFAWIWALIWSVPPFFGFGMFFWQNLLYFLAFHTYSLHS